MGCSCHPWRNSVDFDWPQPCLPWQVVRQLFQCPAPSHGMGIVPSISLHGRRCGRSQAPVAFCRWVRSDTPYLPYLPSLARLRRLRLAPASTSCLARPLNTPPPDSDSGCADPLRQICFVTIRAENPPSSVILRVAERSRRISLGVLGVVYLMEGFFQFFLLFAGNSAQGLDGVVEAGAGQVGAKGGNGLVDR